MVNFDIDRSWMLKYCKFIITFKKMQTKYVVMCVWVCVCYLDISCRYTEEKERKNVLNLILTQAIQTRFLPHSAHNIHTMTMNLMFVFHL